MFSLNRVQLIGYVTQPVSVRQTPSGTSVADINVATPYTFTTDSGETLSGTAYHSVTAWSGMADVAGQYLKPGSQVFLSGRLQTDSWEDESSHEKKSKTRIVAMDLIMLDPRNGQIELSENAKSLTNCLNRADIIGNLTKDPEVRTTTAGHAVVSMGIATNERWKDRASNEIKERTEFNNVVLWGDLAKLAAETLKKGQRVHVYGRVQTRSWETKQGSKRYTTEIVADGVSLLGVKNTDLTYSNEAPSFSKSGKSSESPAAVSAGMEVPPVNYESEVKVEDLPF
ncbi:MAG TPA: single-stranded DNA-binding protein [Candidatus Peribacterales bacterium]|nr:single-stranded DNA-binding protein [Candidatus Peribacterales bacterium]